MGVQRFVGNDGFGLTVSYRREAFFLDTMRDEVVTATLGTFETQLVVELIRSFHIGVRTEFNGDIGVIVQQFHQLLQFRLRGLRQFPSSELIEDILHFHGSADRAERKIERIGLAVLQTEGVPLLFGIKETACCSQHHVFHVLFDLDLIRTVATGIEFTVRTVRTHESQFGIGYRVA